VRDVEQSHAGTLVLQGPLAKGAVDVLLARFRVMISPVSMK
jgi:hypothetical protein